MGRVVKTYARQFRTAYRHRHGHVRRMRYTRRFESMFHQIRASQQQVHAVVRSIEIIVVSYVQYFDVNNLYGWAMC